MKGLPMSYHREMHARLLAITEGCRDDMHEPDEQGISARVVGTRLDNAFGDSVTGEFLERGYQELVVILERESDGRTEKFNLASLIALARKAMV
jgi:hypothetical protein